MSGSLPRPNRHDAFPLSPSPSARLPASCGRLALSLALLLVAGGAGADDAPLRVAVYDAPPYGHLEPDGSINGVSVELWRRTAEAMGREYRLIPVRQMKAIIDGVARNDYDAAIGAITITPERLAQVDFSYPAHRSGVAVAVRKDSGPLAAFRRLCRGRGGTRSADRDHPRAARRDGRGDVDRREADAIDAPRFGGRVTCATASIGRSSP